jgi:hypothetical protein
MRQSTIGSRTFAPLVEKSTQLLMLDAIANINCWSRNQAQLIIHRSKSGIDFV